MEVKICGITNLDDAYWAVESGAHALGLVFYPKSPRFVSPEDAARIVEELRGMVAFVGVFVNEDPRRAILLAKSLGLDFIQLHGHENPEEWRAKEAPPLIKATRTTEEELSTLGNWSSAWAILVDGFDPTVHSSTGRAVDWSVASTLRSLGRLILAGGLHEGNLREAARIVRPDAVDVSSGVEATPGRKDPRKMKRFIELARTLWFGERSVFRSQGGQKNGRA
jgi:phosphoribosylanthranilate isomerase